MVHLGAPRATAERGEARGGPKTIRLAARFRRLTKFKADVEHIKSFKTFHTHTQACSKHEEMRPVFLLSSTRLSLVGTFVHCR